MRTWTGERYSRDFNIIVLEIEYEHADRGTL
jgi:hypothetical protein